MVGSVPTCAAHAHTAQATSYADTLRDEQPTTDAAAVICYEQRHLHCATADGNGGGCVEMLLQTCVICNGCKSKLTGAPPKGDWRTEKIFAPPNKEEKQNIASGPFR